jgi:DNA-binding NtrC family response regulator
MAKVLFVQPNTERKWDALAQACGVNKVTLFAADRCREAEDRIDKLDPEVVVCTSNLPDGDWRRILQVAKKARTPANVIVVSQHEDVPLYMTAMESGAYDFATLQTSTKDLSWILRSAIGNAEDRRAAMRAESIASA